MRIKWQRRVGGLWLSFGLLACQNFWQNNPNTTQISQRQASGPTAGTEASVGMWGDCMATVIAPQQAITAAHCAQGHSPQDFLLRLGGDLTQPQFQLPVQSIQLNPNFNAALVDDVALLNLGVNAPVPAAPIVAAITTALLNTPLTIFGFGVASGVGRSQSGVLQSLNSTLGSLQGQTLLFPNLAQSCFGAGAAPVFMTDASNTLLLLGITSYTTAADCSAQSAAQRLDTVVDFLGVVPVVPAGNTALMPLPQASSSCGSVSSVGYCRDDHVVYCAKGVLQVLDCKNQAQQCVWSYSNQQYACANVQANGSTSSSSTSGSSSGSTASSVCGGESFQGRCQGNTSVWCYDNNQIISNNCSAAHKVCGYNTQLGYYDCLAPGTPTL